MDPFIGFIIIYLLIIGLRIEVLHGKVDEVKRDLKGLIRDGIVQEEKFDIDYELPEESVRKIANIVIEEIKKKND